ncbi:Splicing factor, arginine/serine-rich [Echinococcus granulosus]|uniref:Splicing factor, arginine/serine-rich n=1 Tax=Echinococcus granulosus TaxID=6210 RepID=W6UR00_ECHGR|nr:Splicing factor, arginine/serine-rich [Echinococcus granulosus]EUB63643.1 Splicing factor, arginine/serine-rich [Echinococcus granulosus]
MDQSQLEGRGDLRVVGCRCSLFNDPEKSLEINSGKLLVPWANNSNLTIDRFDCRGYLQDVTEYDADSIVQRLGSQTAEDADLEEMCNYERYLELQTDTHDVAILQGDNPNKETEGAIGTYTTVGFSYDENESEEHKVAQDLPNSKAANVGPDKNETSKEHVCEPYICPPDLVLPSGVVLPDFERQATIIEKTAVFIARNNAQMEIVNPDEPYEIKLPKIDISKTAYASLIKRLNPNHSSVNYAESDDRRLVPDIQRNTSAAETMEARESSEFSPLSEADYEHCYQEYYRYYYPHYYTHFLKGDNAESANESYLVAESARAAATAASAAVNAMRQSYLASKSGFISPPSDLRGIIDKMAEYVARNGEEFQEVVKKQKQNDTRFAFLQTGHIHHDYYLAKKKEFVAKACPSMRGETRSPNIEVDRDPKHATLKQENNSPTVARNKSISFRLIKSVSSSRLKGMDESSPSPAASCEDPSILRTSSYSVLPGMSNYSSASDIEENNEKDPPNFSPSLNTHDGESMERTFVTVLEVPNASLPNGSQWEATTTLSSSGRSPTPPCSSRHDTTPSVFPTTVDGAPKAVSTTILTPEEIARDIQSMEEQARLQLERRKRAALFAAKLRQSKLMKVEREVEEEGKHSRMSSHLTLSPSQSIILQTATAAPPPPPSSVPAAVAHAVVAQLKTQRERALEAAAAAGDERKKACSPIPFYAYLLNWCRTMSGSIG